MRAPARPRLNETVAPGGDTGMTYQVWQAQWNQAMDHLVRAYQSMASAHEANTMAMVARDQAEAAKWGG